MLICVECVQFTTCLMMTVLSEFSKTTDNTVFLMLAHL